MRRLMIALVLLSGCASFACGGSSPLNPFASDPTTGSLHIGVDVSTCYALGSVVVSIDGTVIGTVLPGGAGLSKDVSLGGHTVSAIGTPAIAAGKTTWTPTTVTVTAGGFNYTLYCTSNRGVTLTRTE